MCSISGRALHYVFKIAERKQTAHFYKNILGMTVLRHEEFSEGCEAACNGPYANRWSKTMIGYGSEDEHFVIELTYNYPVKHYDKGNDFIGITIKSKSILARAKALNWPISSGNVLEAPGGYKFFIDESQPESIDVVEKVSIACSNLQKSLDYWNGILGLEIFERFQKSAIVGFKNDECKLHLQEIDEPIDRAQAYGRIAFSCPYNQQPSIDQTIRENNQTILTPLITLDTPGKATVRVIILADPDGHEICFVEDEGFRKLSKPDADGDAELEKQIQQDKY